MYQLLKEIYQESIRKDISLDMNGIPEIQKKEIAERCWITYCIQKGIEPSKYETKTQIR